MLLKKLSEPSRKALHKIYMEKYHPDPNKLYKNLTSRRQGEQKEELDRFYRKHRKESAPEKMQELGFARPRKRVHTELEAEELGSVLLFKVPRHCQNIFDMAE